MAESLKDNIRTDTDSAETSSGDLYRRQIRDLFINNLLEQTDFDWAGARYEGKVRDVYDRGSELVIVATDRQSAFDISWCSIPLKGQVLTQISNWWFERIKHVLPTHIVATPDPNAVVAKKLKMFPIEIVVRAYLTGSTETSVWVNYQRGVRMFCGNPLPDGMVRNQPLPEVIITPTTKAKEDELIDAPTLIKRGLATEEQWQQISTAALALFREGQRIAAERGLILVDTKYEFGLDAEGVLTIGDEVHTPDSSRYWIAASYPERFAGGLEPESLDKEFFRRWLVGAGFDPHAKERSSRPTITDDVRADLALKYINLYERMTGERFTFPEPTPIAERVDKRLRAYLHA